MGYEKLYNKYHRAGYQLIKVTVKENEIDHPHAHGSE
jgi:hypothetical protein